MIKADKESQKGEEKKIGRVRRVDRKSRLGSEVFEWITFWWFFSLKVGKSILLGTVRDVCETLLSLIYVNR